MFWKFNVKCLTIKKYKPNYLKICILKCCDKIFELYKVNNEWYLNNDICEYTKWLENIYLRIIYIILYSNYVLKKTNKTLENIEKDDG